MIFDLKNPLGKKLTIKSKSTQRHLYDFFVLDCLQQLLHSTSWSFILFVCCWPWLLAVLSAESIIEIELSRWDFNLSLVLRSLSVSQQTTLSADESPSFFPEFFHRFFYNSMKKWTNVELSKQETWLNWGKNLFHIDKKRRFKRKQLSDEVSKTVVSSKNGGRWEKFQSKTSHVSRIWRGL